MREDNENVKETGELPFKAGEKEKGKKGVRTSIKFPLIKKIKTCSCK